MTKLDGKLSDESYIMHSVPQGSILGPLLFSLYVNDLPNVLSHGRMSLYADNTAICATASNPKILKFYLETELSNVMNWYQRNKLVLNLTKTKSMLFGTSSQLAAYSDFNIQLGDQTVEIVDKFKYLGFMLDSRLNFHEPTIYLRGKTFA